MSNLKRTSLYEEHLKAGAKLIDFGGWEMPVQYAGVIEEHKCVRNRAGLFDVSHMGEINVSGKDATNFLQYIVTNDITRINDGQILYTPMCYPNGGVVDDLLVYRYDSDHFLLVVNASNTEKDYEWIKEHAKDFDVMIENISSFYGQFAIQGPMAQTILQRLTSVNLEDIKYYWFTEGEVCGIQCIISRTGYTGEDGFEIYLPTDQAPELWRRILQEGSSEGIQPIGLGARDTLRFESGLPLYGNELGADITPLEAKIGFFVKLDKEKFIGHDALKDQKEKGVPRKLVGLEMIERGIARSHYQIKKGEEEVGYVTSGSFAPTLNKNIAFGLIRADLANSEEELEIMIRNKAVKAKIVPTPFYKRNKVNPASRSL